MKKIIMFTAVIIILAGCAMLAPEGKADWTGISTEDTAMLKNSLFKAGDKDLLAAAADVLKSQGWAIDPACDGKLYVQTIRKHGVTFYGSADYSIKCTALGVEAGTNTKDAAFSLISLRWETLSYVTDYLTKADMLDKESSDKWNIAVYNKLVEKGVIKANEKSELKLTPAPEKTAEPAATATPPEIDKALPPPPKEE